MLFLLAKTNHARWHPSMRAALALAPVKSPMSRQNKFVLNTPNSFGFGVSSNPITQTSRKVHSELWAVSFLLRSSASRQLVFTNHCFVAKCDGCPDLPQNSTFISSAHSRAEFRSQLSDSHKKRQIFSFKLCYQSFFKLPRVSQNMKRGKEPIFKLGITTAILFALMLILSILFFVLLDFKTEMGFGIPEIIFSTVLAVFSTVFLLWVKSLMKNNIYLGLWLGLIVLASAEYSLFLKFSGQYTTIFGIASSLIILIYLLKHFYKNK